MIRAWLTADRQAPRKQRHTARRVWQRLCNEYGATVAESTVRAYVALVNLEQDNTLAVVTVPQTHGPGEEAEVDFGEFAAYIDGALTKCWMFWMAAGDVLDDDRHIARRPETVGQGAAAEAPALRPLPAEAFDPCAELTAKVDTPAGVGEVRRGQDGVTRVLRYPPEGQEQQWQPGPEPSGTSRSSARTPSTSVSTRRLRRPSAPWTSSSGRSTSVGRSRVGLRLIWHAGPA